MKKTIAIIDYDLGNLFSVKQACDQFGYNTIVTDKIERISSADALILPGVGSFGTAMRNLNKKKLIEPLIRFANSGKPFIGICLGMQLLFSESNEFGLTKGLGLIPGKVIQIPNSSKKGNKIKVPHMGWNSLILSEGISNWKGSILQANHPQEEVYFTHSYMGVPSDKNNRLADCIYGDHRISAVVKNKNIIGCQFHPEKSGKSGLEILKQFIRQ